MAMLSWRLIKFSCCLMAATGIIAGFPEQAAAQNPQTQWQQLQSKQRPAVVPKRPPQAAQRVRVPTRRDAATQRREPVANKAPVERAVTKQSEPTNRGTNPTPNPPPVVHTAPAPSQTVKRIETTPAPQVPPANAKPTVQPNIAAQPNAAAQKLQALKQQRIDAQQKLPANTLPRQQQATPITPSPAKPFIPLAPANSNRPNGPVTNPAARNAAAQKLDLLRQQRRGALGQNLKQFQAKNPTTASAAQAKSFVPLKGVLGAGKAPATLPPAGGTATRNPLLSPGGAAAAAKLPAALNVPAGSRIAGPNGVWANSILNRKLQGALPAMKAQLPPPMPGSSSKYTVSATEYPQLHSMCHKTLPPWARGARIPYWIGGTLFALTIAVIVSSSDDGPRYIVSYEEPDPVTVREFSSGKRAIIYTDPPSSASASAAEATTTTGSESATSGPVDPVATAPPPVTPPPASPTPSGTAPPPAPPAKVFPTGSTATLGTLGGGAFEACMAATERNQAAGDVGAPPSTGQDEASAAPAQLILETGGHMAQIRSLVFTPGAKCLISAGDDKVIRIWSLATGRSERVLRGEIEVGPKGTVHTLALSPDGALLAASGSMDVPDQGAHAIRLYDLRTGEITGLLTGHVDEVRSLAFSPNGTQLLSGSLDKNAVLWDVAARGPMQVFSGHTGSVIAVAFSQDGRRAATASHDGTARLWDNADGREIATLKGHETPITGMTFVGEDGAILTASQDGDMKLWNGLTGQFQRSVGHVDFVPGALAPSPDGNAFVVTCAERCRRNFEQRVVNLATGKAIISYKGHDGFVAAAAVSAGGIVATGGGTGHEIHLWKIAEAKTEQVLKGAGRTISATGFFPDSRTFAWSYTFANRSHLLRGPMEVSIDLPDEMTHLGQPVPVEADAATSFVHAEDRAGAYALDHAPSADSNAEGTGGGGQAGGGGGGGGGGAGGGGGGTGNNARPGAAVIRIRQNGQVVASIEPGERLGKTFAYRTYGFISSGTYLMAGGDNGLLEAYDLKGAPAMSYVGHTSTVWSQTPSPDGRFLVSGGGDQALRLWNLSTGELVVSLFHGRDGEWVMWTPQGYYMGSPGGGELVGWHVNRGDGNVAEYVRSQQLRQYLNRPDIVERAITLVSATGAIQELAPNHVNLEQLFKQGRPPVVVSVGGDNEATGGRSVIVVGVRENPLPVETIDVWVRDRKVASTKVDLPADLKREPGIEYTALEIPLFGNDNFVRVVATNEIGSSDQTDKAPFISIRHNGEGLLDKRGTLYVVAVGIDKYPGMPKKCGGPDGSCDLQFAGRDAEGFAATVESVMKSAHERVHATVLVNGRGPKQEPTHANIVAALAKLKDNVKDNDTVALFFAGHGDNVGAGYYFLPTDVTDLKGSEPGDNFMPWSEVQQTIYPLRGRKLLFLDACRAGNSYYQQLGEDAKVSRFVAFTAAKGSQFAEEAPDLQHGQFTYAVMGGLKGEAEDKAARAVLVLGLANYVSQEVAKRTKGRQEPELFTTPGDGNYPIVKH